MGSKYNLKFWRIWIRYTPGAFFEVLTLHYPSLGEFQWVCRYSKEIRPTHNGGEE